MPFVRKHSGDSTKPIVAVYTCPEHGEFDAEVQRDANGEAPDEIECPCEVVSQGGSALLHGGIAHDQCCRSATWTPSPISCRVRRIEAVKGKWEKPERKTYLDTRELAEGMDPEDFQAKRRAIWEEKRQQDVMAVKKGFG